MQMSQSLLNVGGKHCPGLRAGLFSLVQIQSWEQWDGIARFFYLKILMILLLISVRHQVLSGQELQYWVWGVGLFWGFLVLLALYCSPVQILLLGACWLPQQNILKNVFGRGKPHLEVQQRHRWGRDWTAQRSLPEWDSEDRILEMDIKVALLVGLKKSSWAKLILVCSLVRVTCSELRPSLLRNWKNIF